MPAFGSRPQAIATPSVIVAWTSWTRATGSHARAIRMASRASRWASEKMPSTMCSWARVATTVARSGDGSRGTSSTARRDAARAPVWSPAARRMWAMRSNSRPMRTRSDRTASRAAARPGAGGRRPRPSALLRRELCPARDVGERRQLHGHGLLGDAEAGQQRRESLASLGRQLGPLAGEGAQVDGVRIPLQPRHDPREEVRPEAAPREHEVAAHHALHSGWSAILFTVASLSASTVPIRREQ